MKNVLMSVSTGILVLAYAAASWAGPKVLTLAEDVVLTSPGNSPIDLEPIHLGRRYESLTLFGLSTTQAQSVEVHIAFAAEAAFYGDSVPKQTVNSCLIHSNSANSSGTDRCFVPVEAQYLLIRLETSGPTNVTLKAILKRR